jgi:hypothetical protein
MLVLLVFGFSGYVLINSKIGSLKSEFNELKLNVKADFNELKHNVKAVLNELKYNDFAHLCNTIEALTFTLEKNGYLKREDKEYIDRRLEK